MSSREAPTTKSSVASSSVRCSARRTWTIGPNGSLRSPRSKHCPRSTNDGSDVRATSSETSRVLPTPASPPISTVPARSSTTAAFHAPSSCASSARRPTNRELEARVDTATSLVQPGATGRPNSDALTTARRPPSRRRVIGGAHRWTAPPRPGRPFHPELEPTVVPTAYRGAQPPGRGLTAALLHPPGYQLSHDLGIVEHDPHLPLSPGSGSA